MVLAVTYKNKQKCCEDDSDGDEDHPLCKNIPMCDGKSQGGGRRKRNSKKPKRKTKGTVKKEKKIKRTRKSRKSRK